MESIPEGERLIFDTFLLIPSFDTILAYLAIFILLICSALISGSEVAFFSIKKSQKTALSISTVPSEKLIFHLLAKPRHLLATILIANNFVNIGIIILSSFTLDKSLIQADIAPWAIFLINVVLVTFVLVLFGEIAPKIYANINNIKVARFMARPLNFLNTLLLGLSNLLVKSTEIIEKRLEKQADKEAYSLEEIEHAIEITMQGEEENETTIEQETNVLKNILLFGNSTVKQVMRSRLDILAIAYSTTYHELLSIIEKNNYSRIPVYEEHLDETRGVLYVKDLIPYLNEPNDFNWQEMIRPSFFTFESEKLEDLLHRFKMERIHLAIVVDEDYGGVSGIITMEDVLEEVTGDIEDEFDQPSEANYLKFDDCTFILEGKTLLNDVCRITNIDMDTFEEEKNNVDSIAGLVLQLAEGLPNVNEKYHFKNFILEPVAVNDRSISQVKFIISEEEER